MRLLGSILTLLTVTGLAACGDGGNGRAVVAGSESAPPYAEAVEVDCGGAVFYFEQLTEAPSTDSLAQGASDAVDDAGEPAFDPALDWKVVHQSEERIELVRQLEAPHENGEGDIRTHEYRILAKVSGAENVPDGAWLLTKAGTCAPRLITDTDLQPADLTLPSEPPSDASSITLLVHERACASGRSAEGRIEIIELEEMEDQIRLHVGVRPRQGGQTCEGNPPTPFTIELTEPLGGREIVDGSIVPPREVPVGRN